ncbi:DUF4253 domain-containing protein [Micromonospora siamensis]|uniref:DUF4253 domain-containing protein n=1 Tax=Micromonospora siamensis TaxID=299152 RepID=A0A1C5IF21_9ACTN|nr:DUF4253 domain-containing protein [Micromonospora siamensis]SCG56653.1 protein of unknown function [Micromonospora siamensis]
MNSVPSILDAVGLGGRPATTQDAAGSGTAVLVDVSPDEALDAWATARTTVDRTGRWPVLCQRHLAHDGDLFSRFYFDEGADGADASPAAVLARAERIDVDARLVEWRTQYPDGLRDWVDQEIDRAREDTRERYGDAPDAAQIRAAVSDDETVEVAIEGSLFDWEHGRPRLVAPDPGIQEWYGSPDELTTLVLLPVPQPWAVYAYVNALHDSCAYGQDLLVAAARRWYERHGAEPVAALEVSTWLRVTRPPTDPREAWRLATEHHTLAENTLATPAVALREHAHLLTELRHWVLFSRP